MNFHFSSFRTVFRKRGLHEYGYLAQTSCHAIHDGRLEGEDLVYNDYLFGNTTFLCSRLWLTNCCTLAMLFSVAYSNGYHTIIFSFANTGIRTYHFCRISYFIALPTGLILPTRQDHNKYLISYSIALPTGLMVSTHQDHNKQKRHTKTNHSLNRNLHMI